MAVSEETLPVQRSLRVLRPGRRFLLFVVASLLGAAAIVGGLVAYHESLTGRILPGVTAAGVELGGMTPDQARATLTERLHGVTDGNVVVSIASGSLTIPFGEVGRTADVDRMVGDAAAIGRGGSWLDETVAAIRTRLEPESVDLRVSFDANLAAAKIATWADGVDLAPRDASARLTTAGFVIDPGVDGRQLDRGAAIASLTSALADPALASGTVLTAKVVGIPPARTTADAERALAAANAMVASNLGLKSGSNTWTLKWGRIRTWIGFDVVNGVYQPVVDRSQIPAAFAGVAKKLVRPVRDAAFLRDKHGRIVGAVADSAGRELDLDATTEAVVQALQARAAGTPTPSIALPLAAILPNTKTSDVTKTAPLMVKIGAWTTHYQVSAHNGFSANITVPTRKLNGTVVQPGQVFDFWAALGEVSFRTGYKLGGAIVGGHSVEGKALAGGICAASTTLFNAALRAGYEIDARQPHWYYITRYPLGLDATVSGTQTMRFRNDTPYPLLIRGFASPGYVHYEIWTVPNGRTTTISRPIVKNVVKGYDTVVRTASMPAGTSERTEWPVDGKDVWVTRTVRDSSGRIVHQETYFSHYHRMVGINMVGTG
jgi:vancomycin resistance protein YoaR